MAKLKPVADFQTDVLNRLTKIEGILPSTDILSRIESEILKLTKSDAASFDQSLKLLQSLVNAVAVNSTKLDAVNTRLDTMDGRLTAMEASLKTIGDTVALLMQVVNEILKIINQPPPPPDVVGIEARPTGPATTH